MAANKLVLLDATLRDGSYSVEYQFNADDTKLIAKVLDEAGVEMIEIGPGVGLNAQKSSVYKPAATDAEYIKAAKSVVKNAKIGAFFSVGVGREEDIILAAENGLDFLRIGINVDQYEKTFPYVKLSKEKGMFTCINMMKSYAVQADEFARIADACYQAGADVVYIVDSSGGMLPEEVGEYVRKCKQLNSNIVVGFHGHDNLGMGVSNAIAAIDNGATYIDSTVRGLGRSSGNTISEKLMLVLKRRGVDIPQNIDMLLRLSDEIIKPYIQPESARDIIYGYSQFHSSFLGIVKHYADKYNADVNSLIVAYTKHDKLGVDESLLDKIALELKDTAKKPEIERIEVSVKKCDSAEEQMALLKKEFLEQKLKNGKSVFFNITKADKTVVSPILHSQDKYCFGSAEVTSGKDALSIIADLENSVDAFLIDTDINVRNVKCEKDLYYYKDKELIGTVLSAYVNTISKGLDSSPYVFVDVDEEIGQYVKFDDEVEVSEKAENANIIIAGKKIYTPNELQNCTNLKWFVATRNGLVNIADENKTVKFIRIDMTFQVVCELVKQLNYQEIIFNRYGQKEIGGTHYCSGGFIGIKNSIVVDDIHNIQYKYGVANGDGSIDYFDKNSLKINEIKSNGGGVIFKDYIDCSIEQHRAILTLRNLPEIRKVMINSEPIEWSDHIDFVESLIDNTTKRYYAVFKKGRLIGTYNLTKENHNNWERGIITSPDYQGSGLTAIFENMILHSLPVGLFQSITAKVKNENLRSKQYHQKVGYKEIGKDLEYTYFKYIL